MILYAKITFFVFIPINLVLRETEETVFEGTQVVRK